MRAAIAKDYGAPRFITKDDYASAANHATDRCWSEFLARGRCVPKVLEKTSQCILRCRVSTRLVSILPKK